MQKKTSGLMDGIKSNIDGKFCMVSIPMVLHLLKSCTCRTTSAREKWVKDSCGSIHTVVWCHQEQMHLLWIIIWFACKSMRCCTKFSAAASSHSVWTHPLRQHRPHDYTTLLPFNAFCQISKYDTIISHLTFPTQTFLPLGTRTSPPSWQCPSPGASSSSFSWWPASSSAGGKDSRRQRVW